MSWKVDKAIHIYRSMNIRLASTRFLPTFRPEWELTKLLGVDLFSEIIKLTSKKHTKIYSRILPAFSLNKPVPDVRQNEFTVRWSKVFFPTPSLCNPILFGSLASFFCTLSTSRNPRVQKMCRNPTSRGAHSVLGGTGLGQTKFHSTTTCLPWFSHCHYSVGEGGSAR